jgi:hypothetical protein
VAAALPHLTGEQCRKRWKSHFDPSLSTFSQEQDEIIIKAIRERKNLAEAAALLPQKKLFVQQRYSLLKNALQQNKDSSQPPIIEHTR